MYTRLAYSRTYLPMSMRLPIQRKEPAAFHVREGYTTRACAVLYKAGGTARAQLAPAKKHLELISYYTKKIQRAPRSVATAKERANYPSMYRWYLRVHEGGVPFVGALPRQKAPARCLESL